MKLNQPKEWYQRSAEIEGEAEVGAGELSPAAGSRSDTPETDAAWNRLAPMEGPDFERHLADFARKLERERDEARAQWRISSCAREKQAEIDRLHAALKAIKAECPGGEVWGEEADLILSRIWDIAHKALAENIDQVL